jgi:hypothetical protein
METCYVEFNVFDKYYESVQIYTMLPQCMEL